VKDLYWQGMAFTETGDFYEDQSDFKMVIDLSLYYKVSLATVETVSTFEAKILV
jgi:hypothetical protein